ncbi:unnamed protein product [Leptosia nina]|uniref:Uncharacterized protein n=1 Tax=Leptosia nina TaxID=320188 RepID=A0AAV1JH10_9NEOP
MAGGVEDDPNLKGLSRIFNSQTNRGRANVNLNKMAGDAVDESQFKGLSKYFNSQTNRGRGNTAKATYAFFGVVILYFTLKPKKQAAPATK